MTRRSRRFPIHSMQVLIVCLLGPLIFAQAPAPSATGQASPQAAASADAHSPASSTTKLEPGDLIEVSVFGVPDLSTKARISNDGNVYLPLIDYVHVADLTS